MSLHAFGSRPDRPGLSALFQQLLDDIRDLVQQHIELTKAEVKEGSRHAAKVVVLGVAGLILTQVTMIYLGSILMLFLLSLTPLRVIGATITVFLLFLLLTAVSFSLVYREVRRLRSDFSPPQ